MVKTGYVVCPFCGGKLAFKIEKGDPRQHTGVRARMILHCKVMNANNPLHPDNIPPEEWKVVYKS